jgi:Zn-dependent peptidase ImmA (M78 family)/transcriptional regulator with XRE-family HTH domain
MITTEVKLNPKMLILARETRGMTQKELADKLGISGGKLCRVELGDQSLSDETFDKLCTTLQYPESFFEQPGEAYVTSSLNFRRRVTVSQQLLMPIEAKISLYRLHIETLASKMKLHEPKIPVIAAQEGITPEEVARKLRKFWKIPSGPIEDMTSLVESNQIIVVSFDFGTERVDSRAMLTKDLYPVIVLNKSMLGDRQRFSIAYELGHIVMHALTIRSMEADIDHEAKLFAAEFLMPEKDIKKDFEGSDITIGKLGELKRKWKVSMQALLYRACDMGMVTDNQKRYIIGQFNALKIRRREPKELDVTIEKPVLLRDMITKYKTGQKLSMKELAGIFNLAQEEFLTMYS